MGGHDRQAPGRDRGGHDLRQGRQRRRRGLRHARGRLHHVRRPELGRRDPGPHLRSEDEQGRRPERPRGRAHRGDAGVLQVQGLRVPARVRGPLGRHPRDPRRPPDHAGRIRDDEPGRGPGPGHPHGRGLSHGAGDGRLDREAQGAYQVVALFAGRLSAASRADKGSPRGRGDLSPARPRRDPEEARRGRARGPGRGKGPQGSHLCRLRPLLHGGHRPGVRPGLRRTGRADHLGGHGPLEGPHRGAGLDELQGHRGLQADDLGPGPGHAPSPQHARDAGPQGPGLQQRRLHPYALPGHEPGLRRPRFLLRRPVLPPRGAAPRAPVQRLRPGSRSGSSEATATIPTSSPGIPIRTKEK